MAATVQVGVSLDSGESGVGDKDVIAVAEQQLALPGRVVPANSAHHQPDADLVTGAGEGRVGRLGDLRIRNPALPFLIPHHLRVANRGPGLLGKPAIAVRTPRLVDTTIENHAPARHTADTTAPGVANRTGAQQNQPRRSPTCQAVARASATKETTPRAEPADPPHRCWCHVLECIQ